MAGAAMAGNRRNYPAGPLRWRPVPTVELTLPSICEQADRLIGLGVHDIAGLPAECLRNSPDVAGALLVVHPRLATPSALAALLRVNDKPGFVVADMTDVDEFAAIPSVDVPDEPLYLVLDPDRGDAMGNWSPD